MDTGSLNQLHNTGNEHTLTVADRVHLDLLAANVFVYKHGLILIDLNGGFQIVSERFFFRDNLHRSAAKHEAGANEHGISNLFCRSDTSFNARYRSALRLRDMQLRKKFFKGIPVLCPFNRFTVGSDNLYTALGKRLSQIDCGLTAKSRYDSLGLFQLDHVHHILDAQRFKIELIRAGIVGGNGFGVVVDNDRLVACRLDGLYCVNGGIIEFHTLTDTDRTRTKYDDLFLIGYDRLVLFLIGGIEIRNVAVEFGSAGIDHLIDGDNACLAAERINLKLARLPKQCDLFVREAHLFCPAKRVNVILAYFDVLLLVNNVLEFADKEHINGSCRRNSTRITSAAQKLCNGVDTVVCSDLNIIKQLCFGYLIKLFVMQMAKSDFKRADRFQETFFYGSSDTHDLARCFHLRGKRVIGIGKFIKWETRHLGYHVVKRWLEGCGRVGNSDLVQRHTHTDLCRYTRDWVPTCLRRKRRGT